MRARRTGIASSAAILILGMIAVLVMAVASAPAANRDADFSFADFPGPGEVTFGKNVSYRASLFNDPEAGNSTFTHIRFSMTRPVTTVAGVPRYADLVYSSCESAPYAGLTSTEYSCPETARLGPGAPKLEVTVVWQTPGPQSAPPVAPTACQSNAPVTNCVLETTGTWSIKESNNTTPSPDTFAIDEATTLLVQPNPQTAGGYALTTIAAANCTTDSANLVTNLNVGQGNKIATAVCVSDKPANNVLNPGLAIEIVEQAGETGGGFTDTSTICIPNPDLDCPVADEELDSFPFPADNPATFIFRIPEIGFPKGEKLDVAYHNGSEYTDFACTFVREGKTKIWTVTCPATSNGEWRFG